MSAPTTSDSRHDKSSLISHHLRAAKRELQNVLSEISSAATLDKDELDALDQDALEVSSLIRSVANRLAPINKLPNEVLALIPYGFGDPGEREKIVVTLTHVCRAWRSTFVSCASLWTNFDCTDIHKTRVYLERSKSYPINLRLTRSMGLVADDPFFEIAPHAISRLQRLDLGTTFNHLQTITQHLVQPAPLLKFLTINGCALLHFEPTPIPMLTPELFGGDLSSLKELHIRFIRTQLPWRGMNNLTSFSLAFAICPAPSIGQFLDFFEGAPRLLQVHLASATPTFGAQDQRLVTMAHLRVLSISGSQPPVHLLNHLVIPVGAETSIQSDRMDPCVDEILPRSPKNLKNHSNFTEICLNISPVRIIMRFAGPSGKLAIESPPCSDPIRFATQTLARLDTSNTRDLDIGTVGSVTDEIYEAIRSMTSLRTLKIFPLRLLLGLDPSPTSNNVIACPKLEKLICHVGGVFGIETILNFAAGRVSRGVPLKWVEASTGFNAPVRRIGWVGELRKYVPRVDTCVWFRGDDSTFHEDSDEGDDYLLDEGWM